MPLWNSDARSSAVAGIVLGPEARGASRRWDRRSAGAAAFLFSFALMRVNCPIDEGLHLFMWHLLPPLIGVVLSAGAGFLLFRKRSTAPTSFPRRGRIASRVIIESCGIDSKKDITAIARSSIVCRSDSLPVQTFVTRGRAKQALPTLLLPAAPSLGGLSRGLVPPSGRPVGVGQGSLPPVIV